MSRLVSLLVAFFLFGWVLPRWGWALCPMFLGVLLVLGGLRGIVASFGSFDPTSGLGSVLIAFLGVCVVLLGIGMSGHRHLAEGVMDWIGSLPSDAVVAVSAVVGFVLAALADRARR